MLLFSIALGNFYFVFHLFDFPSHPFHLCGEDGSFLIIFVFLGVVLEHFGDAHGAPLDLMELFFKFFRQLLFFFEGPLYFLDPS